MTLDNWKMLVHTRQVNITILDDVINREGVLSMYKRIFAGFRYKIGLFQKCTQLNGRSSVRMNRFECSENLVLRFSLTDSLGGQIKQENDVAYFQRCLIYQICKDGSRLSNPISEFKRCTCGYLQYAINCHRISITANVFMGCSLFVLMSQIIIAKVGKLLYSRLRNSVASNPLSNELVANSNARSSSRKYYRLMYNTYRLLVSLHPFSILFVIFACLLMMIVICLQLTNQKTEIGYFLSLVINLRRVRNYPIVDLKMLEFVKDDLLASVKSYFGVSFILECIAIVFTVFCTCNLFLNDILFGGNQSFDHILLYKLAEIDTHQNDRSSPCTRSANESDVKQTSPRVHLKFEKDQLSPKIENLELYSKKSAEKSYERLPNNDKHAENRELEGNPKGIAYYGGYFEQQMSSNMVSNV
ncbi:hypothetical protein GJ496_011129 [Pomphorhynchus laevis]|nr:hypothetical protein GJ496_011129 [Pomphorhynchus laevis]